MLLSDLIGKPVYCGATARGVVLGVGVNVKNGMIKYLLCSNTETHSSRRPQTDFAIAVSKVISISERITLSKLRTLYPKSCAKLFLDRPVYTDEGIFVGTIQNAKTDGFTVRKIFLDDRSAYPFSAVTAISDAVILKKTPPFPLGQPVHAPAVRKITEKPPTSVSRTLLKKAIDCGRLIELTLSLAPFSL